MREEVITYLKTQSLGSLDLSENLPFDDSGVPLYLKNVKKVYVNSDQVAVDPIISTLNGVNISNEATSVTIYFAVDAKTLIKNYDTIVSTLRGVKDNVSIDGIHNRIAEVATEYVDDLLITQTTITLTKIA